MWGFFWLAYFVQQVSDWSMWPYSRVYIATCCFCIPSTARVCVFILLVWVEFFLNRRRKKTLFFKYLVQLWSRPQSQCFLFSSSVHLHFQFPVPVSCFAPHVLPVFLVSSGLYWFVQVFVVLDSCFIVGLSLSRIQLFIVKLGFCFPTCLPDLSVGPFCVTARNLQCKTFKYTN